MIRGHVRSGIAHELQRGPRLAETGAAGGLAQPGAKARGLRAEFAGDSQHFAAPRLFCHRRPARASKAASIRWRKASINVSQLS